ncbi:MAG TPA: DUF4058 family protein, partial [Anaerolineae bacterium]|nr:DUF4058 family protein [Anaerolineae bacterium]
MICYNGFMHNPFPGMNPYLEHPALWPDVHNSLMAAIRDAIVPKVAPNYYVGLESRAYIVSPEGDRFIGRPDIAVISPIGTLPSTQASDSSGVSVLEIELPVMDKINHYFLEVRAVQNHQLITAIELLSPVNKVDQRGRKTYLEKRQ